MNPVFHLVYISQAIDEISYSDIREILEVSRKNNKVEDITGALVFRDGYFLQVLEGTEAAVKNVLGKIIMDERNFNLRVLIEADGDERLFEDWSMAFLDGDISSNSTIELIDLFDTCLKGGVSQRSLIMPFLRKFRSSAPALV